MEQAFFESGGGPAPRLALDGAPTVSGDTVIARLDTRSVPNDPALEAIGVQRTILKGMLVVRGGQVARASFDPDLSDPQTIRALSLFLQPQGAGPAVQTPGQPATQMPG